MIGWYGGEFYILQGVMTALAGRCCGGLILANLRVSGVDEMRNDIGGYEICWLVILVITVDPKLSTCVCTVIMVS